MRAPRSLRAVRAVLRARYFSAASPGPLANYNRRVADGRWRSDPAQVAALTLLERLHVELESYQRDTSALNANASAAAVAAAKRAQTNNAAAAAASFLQEGGSQAMGRSWMSSLGLGGVERALGLDKGDAAAGEQSEGALIDADPSVRGVYIYGGVGCGKTMLMDLFFDGAPVSEEQKRRVHFHAFMLEVHNRMHQLRQGGLKGDPIPAVAAEIGASCALLCFDEFQVTDIADALVMRRLFESLMSIGGVVMVATSNRAPTALYHNGIQRDLFVPFIPYLERMCEVHQMASNVDYRLQGTDAGSIYFLTTGEGGADAGAAAEEKVEKLWSKLAKIAPGETGEHATRVKTHHGRNLEVPRAALAGGVARFTFNELCKRPLGPSDYIAVASSFHTVFLEAIPLLTLNDVNAVRRFITLIDTLYEHRVKVVVSAAALPQHVFSARKKRGEDHGDILGTKACVFFSRDVLRARLLAGLSLRAPPRGRATAGHRRASRNAPLRLPCAFWCAHRSSPCASSPNRYAINTHDEIFAFERTVSRLTEMQSIEYLERTHREGAGDKSALVALLGGDVAAAPAVFERFDVDLNDRLDPFEAQRLMEELQRESVAAVATAGDEEVSVPMATVHSALRLMRADGEAALWQAEEGVDLDDFLAHLEEHGLDAIVVPVPASEAPSTTS